MDVEYTNKIQNVTNYGETRVEKKKIWTGINIGDYIEYLYYLDDPENEIYKDNIPTLKYSIPKKLYSKHLLEHGMFQRV